MIRWFRALFAEIDAARREAKAERLRIQREVRDRRARIRAGARVPEAEFQLPRPWA